MHCSLWSPTSPPPYFSLSQTEPHPRIRIIAYNSPLYYANSELFLKHVHTETGVKPEKMRKVLKKLMTLNDPLHVSKARSSLRGPSKDRTEHAFKIHDKWNSLVCQVICVSACKAWSLQRSMAYIVYIIRKIVCSVTLISNITEYL